MLRVGLTSLHSRGQVGLAHVVVLPKSARLSGGNGGTGAQVFGCLPLCSLCHARRVRFGPGQGFGISSGPVGFEGKRKGALSGLHGAGECLRATQHG